MAQVIAVHAQQPQHLVEPSIRRRITLAREIERDPIGVGRRHDAWQ
jgi:hypothetical protein